MFKTILKTGAAAAGLEVNRTESVEYKMANLAVEVSHKMTAVEKDSKNQSQTCLGLYGNFFLSILALAESAVRLLIHFLVVLICFLGYYLILCLSCGKAESGNMMQHQMSRISMYSGLMAAMLGNILIPWHPTLYLFHTSSTLSRPYVPHMQDQKGVPSSLDIENMCIDVCCCCCKACGCRSGQCVCCGNVMESALPPYKMAQSALFVVGCCAGCGCYQCTGGAALIARFDELNAQTANDSRAATTAFYQRHYNVPSWDALVASRFGGAVGGQQQNMQQAPRQQYMQQQQVPPAQVNYAQATPVATAQPVYSRK